jgi:hypothetical protein
MSLKILYITTIYPINMSNGSRRLTSGQIFAAVIAILAALIGAYYAFYLNPPPGDFQLSINPMHGSAQPGGIITTQITVQGTNGYKYPVSLSATQLPPNILVSFVPPMGGSVPAFTSNVNFNIGNTVPFGSYQIEIKGMGADGTDHKVTYMLDVLPMVTTIATPTLSPSMTMATPTMTQVTSLQMTDMFYPSGWMGDYGDITYDDSATNNPKSPPTAIKISYSAVKSQGYGWSGIYWQYPDKNWGDNPDGIDLSKYSKVTFWARGEKGGEKAEFKVGGIEGKYPDSIQPVVSTGVVILSSQWQKYSIDLSGKNRSHIVGGFVWVTNKDKNPLGSVIYLDDIQYE